MLTLTCAQCRDVDARAINEYGVPGVVLMENAGRGVVDWMQQAGPVGLVTILCGGGNNAGDGLVMARHLDGRGFDVRIVTCLPVDRLPPDSLTNYRIIERSGLACRAWSEGIPLEWWHEATWIVDALLGTGARGAPRPPLDAVITRANATTARRLAVDVPSGLNADTGEAAPATFRADVTCTFVAPKPGLIAPDVEPYVGQLQVVDIGAPGPLLRSLGLSSGSS
ncbi:MAG: NAD(P)H-hydrate epimerase [Pirellulales bacterium]